MSHFVQDWFTSVLKLNTAIPVTYPDFWCVWGFAGLDWTVFAGFAEWGFVGLDWTAAGGIADWRLVGLDWTAVVGCATIK